MSTNRVFNFSPGPGALPLSVLERAASEMTNYGGTGMSVMEMSHRSKPFLKIFEDTKAKFRAALGIPDDYEILFMQGGASTQFSAVPLNLIGGTGCADYAVTGNFSSLAMKEAKKYGEISVAASSEDRRHTYIPAQEDLKLDSGASYFYYCSNNTIYGTEWQYVPQTGNVPLVCDMSSNILSGPVDVSKYGLIFAGAQKNMAPAGLTMVIIRRDLAGNELPFTPLMLGYQLMIDKDSMYNTPPCYNIYMLGLVLDWLEEQGGVLGIEKLKLEKAAILYDAIDRSRLFTAPAEPGSRSCMNIVFRTDDDELDAKFIKGATELGMSNIKGHRITNGMRASIYNAVPLEGVHSLAEYIDKFDREV